MAAYVGTLRSLLPGNLGTVAAEEITFTDAIRWTGAQEQSGAMSFSNTAGDKLWEFNEAGATITQAGATSGAIVGGIGTSTTRLKTSSAGKFLSTYFESTVTSGSVEGLYTRTYQSGAGAGVTLGAGRIFGTVNDVTIGNARGLHASLSFGTTGAVTGLGVAIEATLHVPSTAGMQGTVGALKVAINSDAATSDPVGSRISFIQVANQGDATGGADVDDDAALLDFSGFTIGSGNMIEASTTEANYAYSVRCKLPDGTPVYLMLASAAG